MLNAHAFVSVERPPELWSTAVELERFVRLVGEMLSSGLVRNGQELSAITLNISNVTAPADSDSPVPAGEFVAVTVRCQGDWSPEASWLPGSQGGGFVSEGLEHALVEARAAYAYVRVTSDTEGSMTAFLPRGDVAPSP